MYARRGMGLGPMIVPATVPPLQQYNVAATTDPCYMQSNAPFSLCDMKLHSESYLILGAAAAVLLFAPGAWKLASAPIAVYGLLSGLQI